MITTIDVLLFSSQGLIFGVYTEQIEEVLTGKHRMNSGVSTENDMIHYRQQKLYVIDFSLYLDQKRRHDSPPGAEKTDPNHPVITAAVDSSLTSKILVVKLPQHEYMGIHVENVVKILSMPLDQIRTLPAIMETHNSIPGLWGLTFVDQRLVTLLDLTRLA